MSDDGRSSPAIALPDDPPVHGVGSLADDVDLAGIARRLDRLTVIVEQTHKDIALILQQQRSDIADLRERTDAHEKDLVAHRKYVDELAMRRAKKVRQK